MKKKVLVLVAMVVMAMMLAGCSYEIGWEYIKVDDLPAEPESWQSEEAIKIYEEAKLPSDIQRRYIQITQEDNDAKVHLKNPDSKTLYISSDGEEIYLENKVNFFKSGGRIVQVARSWRTMKRYEFASDKTIASTIEIDIPKENSQYVKVAETKEFSIVYDTSTNQYKCLRYCEVIGSKMATNLDALLHAEKLPKSKDDDENSKQIGFQYNNTEYVLVIYDKDGSTTFAVIEKSKFSKSYTVEDIRINGNLELKACVVHY